MGSVGEELVHEIDYHNQPKSVGLNHVLFPLLHLLYCIDVYRYNVQVLAHRHMILLTQIC